MNKIKSQTATTIFQTKFSISPHLTTAYYHLSLPSLNTDFKSEAPQHGRAFLPLLKRSNKKCHVCLPPNRFLASFVDFEEDVFETTIRCCFSNNILASGT